MITLVSLHTTMTNDNSSNLRKNVTRTPKRNKGYTVHAHHLLTNAQVAPESDQRLLANPSQFIYRI